MKIDSPIPPQSISQSVSTFLELTGSSPPSVVLVAAARRGPKSQLNKIAVVAPLKSFMMVVQVVPLASCEYECREETSSG